MSLPTIPNTGTGLTDPLVTVEQYRKVTGDLDSEVADVTDELAEAVRDFCAEANRTLLYGEYTENLYLYAKGMVYPSCTPIDLTKQITSNVSAGDGNVLYDPSSDIVPGGSSIVQGAGVWVGYFSPLPWMPVWTGIIDPQTVITYWGGWQPWQAGPGTTDSLPGKIARILITVAYYSLHPEVVATLGATSQSLGGVSLGGSLSSFMRADKHLRAEVRKFTRPQAHRWER